MDSRNCRKKKFFDLEIDFDKYFSNLVGVTKSEKDRTHKVVIQVNKHHAPYVLTKPIHPSQKLLREMEEGIIIRIDVILNFELERELLGFWGFHQNPVSRYPGIPHQT